MRVRLARETSGISLVEVLVATSIALVATSLACVLAVQARASWAADSGRLDLQQRSRAAADLLTRALRDAGLGHPEAGGPLVHALAPILPRRTGARDADSPETFRRDAISIVRAEGETGHAVLLTPAPAGAAVLDLAPSPVCAALPCGLTAGNPVAVFDGTGQYDVFTVTALEGSAAAVRHHGPGSAVPYPAGAAVVPVRAESYYLDGVTRTLRVYDGDRADFPLVDEVVGVEVEYYGDVRPPVFPQPPPGLANCLYDADGAWNGSLHPLPSAAGGLARLTPSLLTDGPWCGGGTTRFDADLLRIRRVRVRLRLQTADAGLRGADGALFRHPGWARDGVPDMEVVLEVLSPNLAGTVIR